MQPTLTSGNNMNKLFCFFTWVYFLLNSITCHGENINAANLIKVTPNDNAQCVEYYFHMGELYCSTTALSSQSVKQNLLQDEKLKIQFDNRYWQAAWEKKDSTLTTIEYIFDGENINHWNELITSQFFPGLQTKLTPKQFAETFLQNLKSLGYKPIITFFPATNNTVLFEFRIEQPQNQIQDELQMITMDNQGLYVLHYVIKKADMGKSERKKWLQNLGNSFIK